MKIDNKRAIAALFLSAALVLPAVSQAVDPTPTPTPSVTPTPTPSVTPTPTPSVSPTPTPSVSPIPTPTPSVSPTPTPSVSPTPTPSPTPIVPANLISPYWSTVSAAPVVLIADGAQTSSIVVIVKDSISAPKSGVAVVLSSSRGTSDTITAIIGTTNSQGVATFEVSSATVGKSIITAKAGNITINQEVTLNFLAVGSQIGNPTVPNENSGVILYRIPGDSRVYVIKNKKKHWIKDEKEFNEGGYKWSNIQDLAASIIAKYPDSEQAITELIRAIGDSKVYIIKNGKKKWIKTADEFNAAGYKWGDIKNVSADSLSTYSDEQLADMLVKITNALALRVRNSSSTSGAVLDTVKNNEIYTVIEKKNGWYKIKTKKGKEGWIMGKYAKEEDDDDDENDD